MSLEMLEEGVLMRTNFECGRGGFCLSLARKEGRNEGREDASFSRMLALSESVKTKAKHWQRLKSGMRHSEYSDSF